jgi:hypothetical protein
MEFTNKTELMNNISTVMERYISRLKQGHYHSDVFIETLIQCYQRFYKKVKESYFLDLPKYWYYDWYFTPYHFEVILKYCEDDEIFRQEYVLISVQVPMLTPEQYANSRNVKLVTVQKWLIRAKLKTAYKVGRTWKISALTEVPTRGYRHAAYHILKPLENIPEKFISLGLGVDSSSVLFRTSEGNPGLHEVTIWGDGNHNIHFTLNNEEREEFELYLIAEYNVEYIEDPFESMYQDACRDGSVGIF